MPFVSQSPSSPIEIESVPVDTFKALYSIGGMTCAACSGTIARRLSEIDGLSNITVNLLSNSLSLLADKSQLVQQVIHQVEELGYECTLVFTRPTTQFDPPTGSIPYQRSVEIKIENSMCS